MGPLKTRLLSVRRSLPLFFSTVVCLALWQVWLTWRLMEQDRNLAAQRSRERVEQIADLAVAQLDNMLAEWDLSLQDVSTLPPPAALKSWFPLDKTVILLASGRVTATYPARHLLFVPERPLASPASNEFETAERLELPANASDIRWRLSASGLRGPRPPNVPDEHVRRSLEEAQLSGKVDFSSSSATSNPWFNRALRLAAVALMLLVVLAGAYAMHRGVSRELRVAQLQSDFVSAVSREFRSPSHRSAASPNSWRTTVSRTIAAGARATRFWSGRADVCSTLLRNCWTSGTWNPVANNTASSRKKCSAWCVRP